VLAIQGPDIGVSVLGAGNDPVGLGGPVDGGHWLIMLGQRRRQGPGSARLTENAHDVRVEADSKFYDRRKEDRKKRADDRRLDRLEHPLALWLTYPMVATGTVSWL